jgi:hypothetical protein
VCACEPAEATADRAVGACSARTHVAPAESGE